MPRPEEGEKKCFTLSALGCVNGRARKFYLDDILSYLLQEIRGKFAVGHSQIFKREDVCVAVLT